MTFTKRQFFIYRIKQCLNLLNKVSLYMNDVIEYTKKSKHNKVINKIDNNIDNNILKLSKFLIEVN